MAGNKKFILEKIGNTAQGDEKASSSGDGEDWFYTKEVKEHFFMPHNMLVDEREIEDFSFDGEGMVGSPACGDMMKFWIKVDKGKDVIVDCRWRTFGCGSAIASTSMLSVMVLDDGGMKIEDALKLRPQDIVANLGGLPLRKVHCSVLGDKALREAIYDYFRKTGQDDRIKDKKPKMVDTQAKVTDKDIEEAVLDGARTFEDLQKRLKIGIQDKSCIPEAERLLKVFVEKHFGKK